ncbi:MAG: hypothetical protein ABJN74_00035, partial [Gilvibacter sp.]
MNKLSLEINRMLLNVVMVIFYQITNFDGWDHMTNFTKSACIVSKKFIGPALIACTLAGCSVTANNSALLLDTSSKISVVEIPRVNPTRNTNSLPSSKSVFAQTVKSTPEAEQVIEEDALLNDSVVEAKDPNENFNRKVHGFNFGV